LREDREMTTDEDRWDRGWHKVPEGEAQEWDDLYRNVAAFLIRHGVGKAVSVVEFEGQRYMLSMALEEMPDSDEIS